MLRRALVPVFAASILSLGAASPPSTFAIKSPPWLSIESPVSPWDPASRGVAFYVRTSMREGVASLADMSGTVEGLVAGSRRSMPLEFGTTNRPGVYSVRRSWPTEGSWVLRVSVQTTTAIVTLDREGNVAAVRIPMRQTSDIPLPRPVTQREVDSTLAELAKR